MSVRTRFLLFLIGYVWVVFIYGTPTLAAEEGSAMDSVRILRSLVLEEGHDDLLWVRLGYAYLDIGDLKQAKVAFRKSTKGSNAAQAYNGLGLLYARQSNVPKQKAFEYFRRALGADPNFLEARMNIARLHLKLGDLETERALQDVISADSTYGPAYLLLADWYQDSLFYEKRIALYRQYLRIRPDDVEGHLGLAMAHLEQHQYTKVLQVVEPVLSRTPAPDLLPLAAQAYAIRGEADRAVELFETYIGQISQKERALYEDLSLVAFPEELVGYHDLPNEKQEDFLGNFWQKRDPTLISGGKMRLAEHYRRIWYARTFFGEKVYPWDRRGEVYIRYGEPDYRGRSDRVNAIPPSLAVQRVREWNSLRIFGVADTKTKPGAARGWVLKDEKLLAQEEWVYTKVDGGMQLKFVDEVANGQWDFPSMEKEESFRQLTYHPGAVYERVIRKIPEHYDVPPGVEPLEFYYDLATFRGSSGATRLEVYVGVPLNKVGIDTTTNQPLFRVEMVVALLDFKGQEINRQRNQLVFPAIERERIKEGMFVPDVLAIEVPQGNYKLAIQLKDQVSGKWDVYVQELNVPAYVDSLGISDLELAWTIQNTAKEGKFRKGPLWVVPMPSRSYKHGQGVFIYYQLYNLQRDPFGRTKYRVSYTIRRDIRRGFSILGAMVAMVQKLFPSDEEQVSVAYERSGTESYEAIHFELESQTLKPGLNQIEVRVTDLNSGKSVSKAAFFQLEGPQKK